MLRTCHFAVSYAHNIAAPVYLTELLYFLVSLISFLLHASTTCYFLYSHLASHTLFSLFLPALSHLSLHLYRIDILVLVFRDRLSALPSIAHRYLSIWMPRLALHPYLCLLVWILVTYYLLTISAFAATRYRACATLLTSIISFLARFPVSHSSLG